jgi:preprotein translocase subunit SecB
MSDVSNAADAQAQAQEPQVRILAQYVKDLSFENPRAPMSLQRQGGAPAINIAVNVGARLLAQQDFEVVLSLEAKSGEGEALAFQVELQYAGVIRVSGLKPEHVQPFLLIEGPRLLFPFARQIMADAVRNGGFPPLMIDPIDFVTLYRRNIERAQQQGQSAATN